ncbi:MAG: hypothetical protein K940chlam6_00068 [Chlamydiae bacterium]|nr:hypothetical protein [Chlamydiota bacterium]
MSQETFSPMSNEDWSQPLPLKEGPTLLPWPQDAFPETFELYVKELARSTEVPIELPAMLVLAGVATVMQSTFEVQIKDDYSEPMNLWVLGILPPASRKSKIYTDVTAPLRKWEYEQRLKLEPQITSTESQKKTIEARLKTLRSSGTKGMTDFAFEELQRKIEQLENSIPEIPKIPQLWTADITPEHLGTIMAENNEAMAILSDEGGIFDILGGLYSGGKANIDLFLQGHSGSPVRIGRGSRAPIFLNRAVLTMGLTAQPEVIKTICRNSTFKGRGLLGRFLYVIPHSNIGHRKLDVAPMPGSVRTEYQNALRTLIDNSCSIKRTGVGIGKLKLSQASYQKWLEYSKLIESLMGEELGHLSHITDWAGKLSGAIARIAGLLHCMRYCAEDPSRHEIGIDDMKSAVQIGHCLTNHALIIFDLAQADSSMEIAKSILSWALGEQRQSFKYRDCQRKFRRYKKGDLRTGIEVLKEHEIIQEWKLQPEVGRPSDVFELNPYLFDKSKENEGQKGQ